MNQRVRHQVSRRVRGKCEYCQLPQKAIRVTFHIEHIIPRKHLGSDQLSNLAYACHWCNRSKSSNLSGVDPVTNSIVPLFHPRQQNWRDHFHLLGSELLGLTPVGRATIQVLNMNSAIRMAIRQELMRENRRRKPR